MDRRQFIFSMSAGIAASSSLFSSLRSVQAAVTQAPATIAGLTLSQWQLVALIQEQLLPSETNSPGAKNINALAYFQSVITHPRHNPDDKGFLLQGLNELETRAEKKYRHRFFTLNHEQREALLREYEKTRDGSSWLIMLMDYLMEALLSDPIYGGNPKGIGWQWLQHTPGFPRPPFQQQAIFA